MGSGVLSLMSFVVTDQSAVYPADFGMHEWPSGLAQWELDCYYTLPTVDAAVSGPEFWRQENQRGTYTKSSTYGPQRFRAAQ